MIDTWSTEGWVAVWVIRSLVTGGLVLMFGALALPFIRVPLLRHRIAAYVIRASALAPLLCLMPAWFTVAAPRSTTEPNAMVATSDSGKKQVKPTTEDRAEAALSEVLPGPSEPFESAPRRASIIVFELVPESESPMVPPAKEVGETKQAESPPSSSWNVADVLPWILLTYATAVTVFLCRLVVGHLALVRLTRRRAPAEVKEVFEESVRDLSCVPRLGVSNRMPSPVCFGLFRPTVLIPESLTNPFDRSVLRWVFAHESDHIRRGDTRLAWWVGVARSLYFMFPWFWWVRRDLALTQEYLADAAAAACGSAPDYAAFLVDLSSKPSRSTFLAHGVRASRSDLYRRVNMLLTSKADRPIRGRWAALSACSVVALTFLVSGIGIAAPDDPPRESPPPPEKKEEFRQPTKPDSVADLERKIEEATKKGDVDEVKQLVERLKRALTPPSRRGPGQPGERPTAPGAEDRRDAMRRDAKRKLQELKSEMEKIMEATKDLKDGEMAEKLKAIFEQHRKLVEEMEKNGRLMPPGSAPGGIQSPVPGERIERMPGMPGSPPTPPERPAPPRIEFMPGGRPPAPGGMPLPPMPPMPIPGFGGHAGGDRWMWRMNPHGLGIFADPIPESLVAQLDLPKDKGLLVTDVVKGSAADKAGIKKNDLLMSFAGKDVPADLHKLHEMIQSVKPGQKVDIVIRRKGKEETIKDLVIKPEKVAESMKIEIAEGGVVVEKKSGKNTYRIVGKLEKGRLVPSEIEVNEDGAKKSYKSIEEVPESHRDAVRKAIETIGGNLNLSVEGFEIVEESEENE